LDELIPDYIQALCAEIRFIRNTLDQPLPVHSIFLGGGTPSLLPVAELSKLFEVLTQEFDLVEGSEITLEANPDRLSLNYLESLSQVGINRLSLGMQSAAAQDLHILDRQHDFSLVESTVRLIRNAGFENINLDLIYGIPHQTLESWKSSLESALALNPEHLSLYALTIEQGTPLADGVDRGRFPDPNPDLAANMYLWAAEELERFGYQQYEISNWALQDYSGELLSCKHNLQYWHNFPYLGIGAGAHGYVEGIRTTNTAFPRDYIQRCLKHQVGHQEGNPSFPVTPATEKILEIDRELEMGETMMMGLRLTEEGVSRVEFHQRFGIDMEERFNEEIEQLIQLELLEWEFTQGDRLRLTPQGRLLGNQVFINFI
jgi:oxygen-independent coproporphyrinogen-3 oxidase